MAAVLMESLKVGFLWVGPRITSFLPAEVLHLANGLKCAAAYVGNRISSFPRFCSARPEGRDGPAAAEPGKVPDCRQELEQEPHLKLQADNEPSQPHVSPRKSERWS